MSAEKGWIGEPQPERDWHLPGWVKEGGRHFVASKPDPSTDDEAEIPL